LRGGSLKVSEEGRRGVTTTGGERTGGGEATPPEAGTGKGAGTRVGAEGGANGTAAGKPMEGGNDIVRSDAEEAERSSWDKGRCGEAANAAGDATDAVA